MLKIIKNLLDPNHCRILTYQGLIKYLNSKSKFSCSPASSSSRRILGYEIETKRRYQVFGFNDEHQYFGMTVYPDGKLTPCTYKNNQPIKPPKDLKKLIEDSYRPIIPKCIYNWNHRLDHERNIDTHFA